LEWLEAVIYSGTGHRWEVIGKENKDKLYRYATSILPGYKATKVISGMAVGWDQALARAAVNNGIPFIAAVPFEGQESIWPQEAKDEYYELLKLAEEVVIVCPGGYATHKYHVRDKWMVDHGDAMLALWNGNQHGGTFATVKLAKKAQKELFNVWPGWTEFECT
jgi:uncharacterized phage-like protein YoqJ